jgi:phage FluMu gp28-like protein
MPLDLAEQEYHCKFIEGASSVFRKVDEAVRASESDIGLKPFRRYQIGIDLAKHQDYTVITVTDLHTFDIVKQISFNKIDWNEQKEIIVKEVKYWNKGKTWIDSTGIGDPIIDDLIRQGLIIEPFHFTETSREQLLNNLKILLEQTRIKIPNDQELIDQLKAMQYELVGQKVKMRVPEGLHDDRIMSLALSVWGLYEKLPIRDIRELDRQRKRKPKESGIRLKMTSY